MFPANYNKERIPESKGGPNLNVALYGDRILSDQTLYEYLIEFLQVFTSPKTMDGAGKMCFHTSEQVKEGNLRYYVNLRVALRRFIFYGRSKQEGRSDMDDLAYEQMESLLHGIAQNGDEDIDLIHDLLLNYAIVTRNRGWYAQALMPVAPELILAELQGIKQRQKKTGFDIDSKEIDGLFDYSKHNFLARGGQVLYLNLLQGIMKSQNSEMKRERLEKLLTNMLDNAGAGIGLLADFVQSEWENERIDNAEAPKTWQPKAFNMAFIADAFELRAVRFVDEVTTFLSANIHPIARVELLAQGLVVSLLRAMQLVADQKTSKTQGEPVWIMDMCGLGGTSNIAKLSAQSYASSYETFQSALIKTFDELDGNASGRFPAVQKAKKDSSDVFKRLGKEIKLIIPPRGNYERFSLSESLVRYFVLALVEPQSKMIYDTFLDKLYDHFGIVIAPQTYRKALQSGVLQGSEDMADYFQINAQAFQEFLKQSGFLRDLSDSTAIVENPYTAVQV